MNREYKRFLIFLAKAVVIVLCIDFVLGIGLKYAYDHMKSGERARANFVVHESKADVVIFGSSRALYHYHSNLIGDSLGKVVYNAGRPAQSILYHNAMLKMMLKRHHPQMVILDINENEFVYEKRKYDIMSSLLPYYNQDADVHALINSVKPVRRF